MYTIINASRMEVFDNRTLRLTTAHVKAKTGCTHIINGFLFDNDPKSPTYLEPCRWTVVDGKVLSRDEYHEWGIGCGKTGAPVMTTDWDQAYYLSGVPLLKDGQKLKRDLPKDVARPAERTAVGWLRDGRILLWCDRAILTPEQLQDKLLALGCVDALMMDGGGSTQGDFPDQQLVSSRIVSTCLCFWSDEEKEEKPMEIKKKVCLDAGHSASNTYNKSPDGTYYEHEFALDMAKRMKAVLERAGVEVVETRPDNGDVSLGERCRISNAAGVDLFVSIHSNATGTLSTGADGWGNARGWECYVYGLSGARYQAAKAILARVEGVCPAIRYKPIVDKPELYVLKHTNAPAVLIEHGFHTSREDVELLKDAGYRQKMAEAEAFGILDYLGVPVPETQEDSEADQAVKWITETGIMKGSESGDLMLDQPVTRRQFAVMLHRFMEVK